MKSLKILAIARNLTTLKDQLNRIENSCGTIGSSLVRRALENNGRAYIEQQSLVIAIDTSDGENAIADNFILIDENTQSPLLHSLLKKYNQANNL
jgi:hypothetical protein